MPCRYDPTPEEIRQSQEAQTAKVVKPYIKKLDKLTHENDQLRELLLEHAADKLPENVRKSILAKQVNHRQEDLDRLKKTFEEYLEEAFRVQGSVAFSTRDFQDTMTRLYAVTQADVNKPLASQLGFDPDDF